MTLQKPALQALSAVQGLVHNLGTLQAEYCATNASISSRVANCRVNKDTHVKKNKNKFKNSKQSKTNKQKKVKRSP